VGAGSTSGGARDHTPARRYRPCGRPTAARAARTRQSTGSSASPLDGPGRPGSRDLPRWRAV